MDATAFAVALGIIGTASGVGGVIVALRANRTANEANRIAERANEIALGQKAIAEVAASVQSDEATRSRSAEIVLVRREGRPSFVFGHRDSGRDIRAALRNDGKASAREVEVRVRAVGEQCGGASIPVLTPGQEQTVHVRPRTDEARADPATTYHITVSYRDDNGPGSWEQCVHFTGGNYPGWKAESIECPKY